MVRPEFVRHSFLLASAREHVRVDLDTGAGVGEHEVVGAAQRAEHVIGDRLRPGVGLRPAPIGICDIRLRSARLVAADLEAQLLLVGV